MKKSLMVVSVLFLALVTLTGCGEKKLTCTMSDDKSNAKVVAKFKKDKASTVSMEETTTLNTEEEANQTKQLYDSMLGLATSTEDFMKIDTKVNGKKFTATINLDLSKMTDEQIKENLADDADIEDLSYDGLKKIFEEEGFSCK